MQAQHGLLQQLKAGELDIVISTAVAEEGLDVKQCQLVVRFDLPSTLLAFVQSRSVIPSGERIAQLMLIK